MTGGARDFNEPCGKGYVAEARNMGSLNVRDLHCGIMRDEASQCGSGGRCVYCRLVGWRGVTALMQQMRGSEVIYQSTEGTRMDARAHIILPQLRSEHRRIEGSSNVLDNARIVGHAERSSTRGTIHAADTAEAVIL